MRPEVVTQWHTRPDRAVDEPAVADGQAVAAAFDPPSELEPEPDEPELDGPEPSPELDELEEEPDEPEELDELDELDELVDELRLSVL